MGLKFKKGDAVRQIMPKPIEGVVGEAVVVDDEVHYRVDWTNEDGSTASKHFTESQLEASPSEGPQS